MKFRFVTGMCLLFALGASAQDNQLYSEIGLGANLGLPNRTPFWFRADQQGVVPLPGASLTATGSFHKYYDTLNNPLLDWGGGLVVRGDMGNITRGTVVEGYLKAALSIVEVKVGRFYEPVGLMDTALSSGSFSVSGNALGIPQVEISIPQYVSLPFANEFFAIKGSFGAGWLGANGLPSKTSAAVNQYPTYLQHKSVYVRLGNPDWRIHLTGGINHQVMYGGEKYIFGPGYPLNGIQTFLHTVTEKKYKGRRIGNYLGSIDMGAELDLDAVRIFVYRQNFYDRNAILHLANLADGLNGISISNKRAGRGAFQWHKAVFEFLYSAGQGHAAGYAENYYNDADYAQGWSYKSMGLGNPLMSQYLYLRAGAPDPATGGFVNNRVAAVYGALQASLYDFEITGRASYSRNYGLYADSTAEKGGETTATVPASGVGQFSAYLIVSKEFPREIKVHVAGALDYGKLLYNSLGLSVGVSKAF